MIRVCLLSVPERRVVAMRAAEKAAKDAKWQAAGKAWRERNKKKVNDQKRAYMRVYGLKMREHYQSKKLERAYGITLAQYNAMSVAQSGLCAICGRPPRGKTPKVNRLYVDHDHATGRVRQLLCFSCNAGLGCYNDDPGIFAKAVRYLARHSKAGGA